MNQTNPACTFLAEAEDLLVEIENIALEINSEDPRIEDVHRLFRAFHTIKGSGAMFGFDQMAAFTHHVETLLDQVRDGRVPVSVDVIKAILAAKDQIKGLLDCIQNQSLTPFEVDRSLVTQLQSLLAQPLRSSSNPSASHASSSIAPALSAPPDSSSASALGTFLVRFRPNPNLMVTGTDPRLLLDELRTLGTCAITAHMANVPTLEELQSDQCFLAWEAVVTTNRDANALKDVFIFVEEGSDISVQHSLSAPGVEESAVDPRSVLPVPTLNEDGVIPKRRPKDVAVPAAPVEIPGKAAVRRLDPDRSSNGKDSSVRVPSERLDRLVTLVGELVMNQSQLAQAAASVGASVLAEPVEQLDRLVAELRDTVLGIRMTPIGTTFNRFKRLVHDLSQELGKEIDLVTEGAETELDKSILDQLGDPLVHIIRNSIDHGIELPEVRLSLGKPRRGTIHLQAAHVGSNVVITVQDDGRGLDHTVIRSKAIEKRIILADAKLTPREVLDLVFLPGFSTASQVTSVSGRGVGMDVVRRKFQDLRGQVHLSSNLGQGTQLTLTLPLTLAIIDGLLVQIGGDHFILPLSAVTENVELPRAFRGRNNGRNLISVRGDLIPYIRLRELFSITGGELEIEKIVIVRHGDGRVGLVVDRVLGTHQTVIQSLGRFYRYVGLASGSTILGDGRVALILDLAGLLSFADRNEGQLGQSDPATQIQAPRIAAPHHPASFQPMGAH